MLPPYLDDAALDALLRRALDEDLGPPSRDVTTAATVPAGAQAEAQIRAKERGVAAGLEAAHRVFRAVDPDLETTWHVPDGAPVAAGQAVGHVRGRARGLLTAERTALNVLQRMSGIATATRRMVEPARPHGTEILDTRKTAPGLRLLDKWAVRLGGGTNHRLGLYDLILIKDNHIAAAGGVAEALEAARRYRAEHDPSLRIEVEARTLAEVRAALDAGGAHVLLADILLLDNMARLSDDGTVDTSMLAEAVRLIDEHAASQHVRTEASGNVTLATVPAIAATGVDAISSGSLTHSAQALDLSMEMRLDRGPQTADRGVS